MIQGKGSCCNTCSNRDKTFPPYHWEKIEYTLSSLMAYTFPHLEGSSGHTPEEKGVDKWEDKEE